MIYFIQSINGGPIKIGLAENPVQRLKSLQTGHPETLVLLTSIAGGRDVESALHSSLSDVRIRGEWFEGRAVRSRLAGIFDSRYVLFNNREYGFLLRRKLRLTYEIDCSSWGMEFEGDSNPQAVWSAFVGYWSTRYDWSRWPIVWSVIGDSISESAPFQHKYDGCNYGDSNFLTYFTHPVWEDTEEEINWFDLPVVPRPGCDFLERASGWSPSPLQEHADLRAIAEASGLIVPPSGDEVLRGA